MLGPWVVVLVVLIIVGMVVWTTGGRSRRDGGSTAGHYDPDAIGRYTLDPATMAYRHELPTLPRSGAPPVPSAGPPHRRRRRRRRPDAVSG